MPIPSYGAAPLAKTFLIVRLLQIICFGAVIAITAIFTSNIVADNGVPPVEIIATLTVTSTAALFTLLSVPFFLAHANLSLLIMCAVDFFVLIALVVVAVTLGKPISYLNCFHIAKGSASSAADFATSVSKNLNKTGNLVSWVGATKANCFETKGVWCLSIALCILFLCSVLVLPALFAKQKRAMKTASKTSA